MMGRTPEEAYKLIDCMKSDRSNWENLWQDLADYVIPNKNDITSIKTPGQKRNLQIYDSTGVRANEQLAGALHGMLTNPSSYFFELFTGNKKIDQDDSARKWLQSSAAKMHDIMNNSNFQTEVHEVYLDLGSFGTAIMSIEEDDNTVVRFLSHHIAKTYIKENNYGFVDTVVRIYTWSAQDIVKFLGNKDSPAWLMKMVDTGKGEDKLEITNLVEPRDRYDNKAINAKRFQYSSCWYLKGGPTSAKDKGALVRESGFRTMPYVTPRWTKGTGETYGRSPSMNVLPDIKMINKMMYVLIRGSEKAIDPPLLIPDDTVMGSVKTNPGGMNYYRSGTQDFIRPLQTGTNMNEGRQTLGDVQKSIRDGFYLNQLQLQEGPQKTATEVMQIREENLRFLGPILGRQQSEFLQPMIYRIFDICERKKIFDPMPAIMLETKPQIQVQYRSTLAKAQLAGEVQNVTRAIQAASPFIQLDPTVADIVDAEAGVRYVCQQYGLPQELFRDKKAIEQIRAAKAQAQAQQQQQMQMAQTAQNAGAAAPAIKAAQSGAA